MCWCVCVYELTKNQIRKCKTAGLLSDGALELVAILVWRRDPVSVNLAHVDIHLPGTEGQGLV